VLDTELVDEVLGARIAGTWSESDGQIENVGAGDDFRASDSQAARANLLWVINDDMELMLRAYYADDFAKGDAPMGLGILPGGTDISGYSNADLEFWESEAGQNGEYGASGDGVAATFNWVFNEDWELTSITAIDSGDFLVEQDADGGPADIFNIAWSADYDQFNQELRLKYDNDSVRVTGGVYYGEDDVHTRNNYNFFGMLPGQTWKKY
jgi:iron complex outermembrane receptor protein